MKRRLASVVRMRAPRRGAVLLASLVVAAAFAGSPSLAGSVHVWRVGTYRGISGQFRTIQAAVDAARPGDWILVAPGDYHENGSSDPELPAGVLIRTPGIHLRGLDRNSVIVDGTRPGAPTPCSSDPAFQVTGRDGVEVYKVSGTYYGFMPRCAPQAMDPENASGATIGTTRRTSPAGAAEPLAHVDRRRQSHPVRGRGVRARRPADRVGGRITSTA